MKILTQVALGIVLAQSAQAEQQIDGRFYPDKKIYLVGEPIFVVLDLTNVGQTFLASSFRCACGCNPRAQTFSFRLTLSAPSTSTCSFVDGTRPSSAKESYGTT